MQWLPTPSLEHAARLNSSALPRSRFQPVTTLTIRELHEELRACQSRLGTAAEREDDFPRARELAHAINNWRQAAYLKAIVAGHDAPAAITRRAVPFECEIGVAI